MTSKDKKEGDYASSSKKETSRIRYRMQFMKSYKLLREGGQSAADFLVDLNGQVNWKTLNVSKDESIDLGAQVLLESGVDVCQVISVLIALKVNYGMTFGFDAYILMLEALKACNALQDCLLPPDLAALGRLVEQLLDPTAVTSPDPTQLAPPASSATQVKAYRKKLRFFCKSIDRIYALFPHMHQAPVSSASVNQYMDVLAQFEQYTGLPLMYALFRLQLEPPDLVPPSGTCLFRLLLLLEERGEFEVCFTLIEQEWRVKQDDDHLRVAFSAAVREFITGALDRSSNANKAFKSLVLDTIRLLGFNDFREQAKFRVACCQVTHNVHKGKWQICVPMCYSRALKAHLYSELRAHLLYKEAQEFFESCDLGATMQVVEVTAEEVASQTLRLALEFMKIPLHAESIVVVDSMLTLHLASCVLGLEDNLKIADRLASIDYREHGHSEGVIARLIEQSHALGTYRGPVGLDSEWDSALQNSSSRGAALLQVACPHFVLLFDLSVLAQRPRAARVADELLHALLASPARMKIGFQFDKSDIHMLQLSAGGKKFSTAFSQFRSVVDIAVIVQMLSNASNKPTKGLSPASAYFSALNALKKGKLFSLSDLCQIFLGKRLDKSQQMSSWSVRPLTAEQRVYAALDAHCLLALLDVIMQVVAYRGDRFEIGVVSAYPDYGVVLAQTKTASDTCDSLGYGTGIFDSVCKRIELMSLDDNTKEEYV